MINKILNDLALVPLCEHVCVSLSRELSQLSAILSQGDNIIILVRQFCLPWVVSLETCLSVINARESNTIFPSI